MKSTGSMLFVLFLINMFLIPLLSLGIHYRRENKWNCKGLPVLIDYAGYTVAVIILTQFPIKLAEKITGKEVQLSSVRYMLLAVVVALLLPYVQELFCKFFRLKLTIEETPEKTGEASSSKESGDL